jgi:hypothetical protein
VPRRPNGEWDTDFEAAQERARQLRAAQRFEREGIRMFDNPKKAVGDVQEDRNELDSFYPEAE